MLYVPRFRQPDAISCLPSCIYAVLTFVHGAGSVSYEEIAAACRLGPRGAVDELAIQGLQDAEWDVEVLRDADLTSVQARLANGQPVILIVLCAGHKMLGHAVVACGVSERSVTVMDPQIGDYVEIFDSDLRMFETEILGGFVVAGNRPTCAVVE